MFSEYKNILANKFMRDTNYIIIKDTDDIEELERQWELFKSCLTVRQQRLSDDRSIEIWNMTNQEHYETLKRELMEELETKLNIDEPVDSIESEDSDDILSNDDFEDFEPDEDFKNYVNIPNDEEIPDEEYDINEPIKEDSAIPTDGKEHVIGDDKDELGLNLDRIKDAQADQYEIDSNINIIGSIRGKTPEEHLENLEKAYAKWNGQNQDHRKKSDDKCREIYGMSNIDRYNMLKASIYKVIPTEKLTAADVDANTVDNIQLPKDESSFIYQVYRNMQVLNEQESNKQKQHRRFNDTPYFTPSEMIDLGVHDNDNFYSPKADNDGLIQGTKIPTWFDSYKDMCLDHIFEDYTKEWIDTLDMLYSDFEQIKESGNEEAILARKQSILDLGWNPEIPFNRRNRLKASKRVNKLLDKHSPMNLFINLDKIIPDDAVSDEPVIENAKSDTHQPIYMVFVQGKAPIISSSIKKVTHSPYSHSGIAFDHTLNTVHSYNMIPDVGLVRETLQGYKDSVITVMAFFAPNKIAQAMKDYVQDFWYNSKKTVYDFGIIFNKLINKNARVVEDKYHQVCSTFVDAVLKSGNVVIDKTANVPSPAELYNSAKTMPNKIIEVYTGPANEYNANKVGKKIKKLLDRGSVQSIEESASSISNQIKLRPATQSDTEYMYNCEMESINKSIRNDPKVISYIKKDVQDSIKDTKMITYNNNTIGMITVSPIDNGEWWYIGELYIDKEYRGNGIGTKLLKDQIQSHDKLKLQVAYDNKGAKRLYESLGFKVINKNDKGGAYLMALDKTDSVNEGMSEIINKIKHHNKYEAPLPSIAYENGKPLPKPIRRYTFETLPIEIFDKYKDDPYITEENIKNATFAPYNLKETTTIPKNKHIYQVAYCNDKYNVIIVYEDLDKVKQYLKTKNKTLDDYDLKPEDVTNVSISSKWCYINKEKNENLNGSSFVESVLSEGISDLDSAESNDIYHNVEDWESGKSNVLWVTGLSGSGKSTISKEISAKYNDVEYVELDLIQAGKIRQWDDNDNRLNGLLKDFVNYKGGFDNIFPLYTQKARKGELNFGDMMDKSCADQFNELFEYIITYTKKNSNRRFVIEGVQIAMCTSNKMINKISKYPVIIKMNGPLKTEFRREKRSIKSHIDQDMDFITTFKHVCHHIQNWIKNGFFLNNWKELNYFRTNIGESAYILNEVKQFPVEFDKEGNLIIYKCRTGSISYGDEIADSVKLLESYRNANNVEGIKYELAKLWFINDSIEKRLKKRLTNDEYKELINQRAICLNVFKLNLEYVMKAEQGFNFSDYYNSTPFSDNSIKITANTIKYSMKALMQI